jgi:hypothetical protein
MGSTITESLIVSNIAMGSTITDSVNDSNIARIGRELGMLSSHFENVTDKLVAHGNNC